MGYKWCIGKNSRLNDTENFPENPTFPSDCMSVVGGDLNFPQNFELLSTGAATSFDELASVNVIISIKPTSIYLHKLNMT